MICNDCGAELKEGAGFCSGCGAAAGPRQPYAWREPSPNSPTFGLEHGEIGGVRSLTSSQQMTPAAQPAMACSLHPSLAAIGACVSCGCFLCRDCLVMSSGRNYCRRCLGSYNPAPLPAPPAQPQQVYIPPVQYVYRRKEPGLAVILSFFMPGLGQFYNGEVGKGLGFLIGFWVLIWVFIGIGFWIWSMADAYQVATEINAGRRA